MSEAMEGNKNIMGVFYGGCLKWSLGRLNFLSVLLIFN